MEPALSGLQELYARVFEREMASLQAELDRRFHAQERTVDELRANIAETLASARRETVAAAQALEKAMDKAEAATERRFESVNEFRATFGDLIHGMVTRAEVDTAVAAVKEIAGHTAARVDRLEGRGSGMQASWAVFVGAVAVIGVVATIIVAVFHR